MNPNWFGVGAILMWSSMTLLLAMASTIPPFQLATMSWFLGFVSLASYYIAKGEKLIPHFRRSVTDYLFVGLGICGYSVLLYFAFYSAPPFEANALNYLWPILLTVFLTLFQGGSMTLLKIAGFLLGFAGCVLLLSYRYGDTGFEGIKSGHIMAIVAAIVWATYSCFAKTRNYPTAFLVPVFLISTIVCFIGHALLEEFVMPDRSELIAILFLGGFRMSYVFWDYAIRQGDRALMSSLAYFVPLLATIILVIGGFGASSPIIYLAAMLIIAGCLIINAPQIKEAFLKRDN